MHLFITMRPPFCPNLIPPFLVSWKMEDVTIKSSKMKDFLPLWNLFRTLIRHYFLKEGGTHWLLWFVILSFVIIRPRREGVIWILHDVTNFTVFFLNSSLSEPLTKTFSFLVQLLFTKKQFQFQGQLSVIDYKNSYEFIAPIQDMVNEICLVRVPKIYGTSWGWAVPSSSQLKLASH